MTPEKLDLIFPFVVFAYGVVMTLVLNSPLLSGLAENRLPPHIHHQLKAHRGLGLLCLVVGGLWSLQNIWL
jgi:hypothetical protein